MNRGLLLATFVFGCLLGCTSKPMENTLGNPIAPGWYADPELRIFDKTYWIYPTYSDGDGTEKSITHFTPLQQQMRTAPGVYAPFLKQTFFNAFSSKDLIHWTRHDHVLTVENISWAAYALWAPSVIQHHGKYYFFFSANNIQRPQQTGGIGIATSDNPQGPFVDALGEPLINDIHNGAQPIDQFVFRDDDGQHYLYYGGWGHCNVAPE